MTEIIMTLFKIVDQRHTSGG